MAENGDRLSKDTLLRIIQRDKDPEKIHRAQSLINSMEGSDTSNLWFEYTRTTAFTCFLEDAVLLISTSNLLQLLKVDH